LVFAPEASSPAVFVHPEAQLVQALFDTYWFVPHVVAVQVVSDPEASWLPVLVFPAGHEVH